MHMRMWGMKVSLLKCNITAIYQNKKEKEWKKKKGKEKENKKKLLSIKHNTFFF